MLRLKRFDNPQAFYDRALPLWMRSEAADCLSIGITDVAIHSPERFTETPYMAAVESDDKLILTALRTPPRGLILSLTDNLDALDPVVEDVRARFEALPTVQAESTIARGFAERWTAKTGVPHQLDMPERIYQVEEVISPQSVSGSARKADPADKDLIVDWMLAFETEAFGAPEGTREGFGNWFDNGLTTPRRGIYVWDDGGVVSLVCHGGPTPGGMRIGPVYTPPERRGHGYASALTAYVSQSLLDSGRKFCFLYTNLLNPTSNKIYQQIGYQPVIDCALYRFG